MAVGMVAHFVAFGGDGAHGLRVAGYTRAEYEERRLDVALAQDAEKPGSVWPGAVIEGDGACVCVRSEHGKREPVENFFGVRRDGAGQAEQGAQEREGGVGHVSLSIMRVYGHVLRPQDQLSQKCKASYRGCTSACALCVRGWCRCATPVGVAGMQVHVSGVPRSGVCPVTVDIACRGWMTVACVLPVHRVLRERGLRILRNCHIRGVSEPSGGCLEEGEGVLGGFFVSI